jgi:foldase protein PrsA
MAGDSLQGDTSNMTIRPCAQQILVVALVAFLVMGCDSTPTDTPELATATAAPTPTEAQIQPVATPSLASGVEAALDKIQRFEDQNVAIVNGVEISWQEYEVILRQMLHSIDQQNAVNWNDPAMAQRLPQLQQQALGLVVDRFILRQVAAEQGISVDGAVFEAEVKAEKSRVLATDVYADWDDFLQRNGLTDETFKLVIHDTMLLNDLVEAQQVDTQSEQVDLAHIPVASEALAQEVLNKLQAGEAFADLAVEYSIDDETKDNGGDLGWFSREMLQDGLVDVVFSLQPGQFSGIVTTEHGYTIFQVLERGMREAEELVIRRRQQQVVGELVDAFKAQSTIEYLVNFETE